MRTNAYETVRRELGDEFPEILELGRKAETTAFLGRREEGTLAVLHVRATRGTPRYLLQVDAALEEDVAVGRSTCPVCGTPQEGWPRYCDACKADLAGAEEDGGGVDAPAGYDLLGSLPRRLGGGPLYFAREAATGRVVGLTGRRGLAGGLELSPAWSPGTGSRGRTLKAVAAGVLLLGVLGAAVAASARDPGPLGPPGNAPSGLVAGPSADSPGSARPAALSPADTGRTATPPLTGIQRTGGPPPAAGTSSPAGVDGRERVDAAGPQAPAVEPSESVPVPASGPQGVEDAIRRYAAAVGSGRTGRIAQAYPGVTAAELERWRRFFAPLGQNARVRAWHEVVSGPTLEGDRAEVLFTLTVAYENGRGEPVERPLPLRARLRWTGSAWALQEVLLLQ